MVSEAVASSDGSGGGGKGGGGGEGGEEDDMEDRSMRKEINDGYFRKIPKFRVFGYL